METTESAFARNVAELRKARQHTVRSLADALAKLGRPMHPSGVTKLENGTRHPGPADLVALAIALGVNPNRLLFPFDQDLQSDCALTPTTTTAVGTVWLWAVGAAPLTVTDRVSEEYDDFRRATWPAAARIINDEPAMRALRRLELRVHDLLRSSGNPTETRRALAVLTAEIEDLIGDDDGKH